MGFQYVPGDRVDVPHIEYSGQLVLHPNKTVLVLIDMQNDFVKENGHLVVPSAAETVPRIEKLMEKARPAGVRVVYTQDTQFENDPEFSIWPQHCLSGSWGWEIIDELKPYSTDLVCRKNRYDGFYGTWLEHFCSRIWKVEHMIIVGTVSNICVLHTAASAGLRWFHVVVPADCISAQTEFDQALTLRQVSSLYAGDVVKSAEQIEFRGD